MAGFDVLFGRPGEVAVHPFSRDDYDRMGDLGILGDGRHSSVERRRRGDTVEARFGAKFAVSDFL